MRVVVTILQCKRAFLPYVFVRYCQPLMRDVTGWDFRTWIIRHEAMGGGPLSTNRSKRTNQRVLQWQDEGMYEGAEVFSHSEWFPALPSLPSFLMAAEIALREDADYHLWLDDDAIVLDEECAWEGIREAGVYRENDIINQAYFVSRPMLDARMTDMLRLVEGDWSHAGKNAGYLLEKRLADMCRRKKQLEGRFAARIHMGSGLGDVSRICLRACPDLDMKQIEEDLS